MDGFELNKYFGAVTGAFMVYLGLAIGSEKFFHAHDEPLGEMPMGFAMDIPEPTDDDTPQLSFEERLAVADAGAGRRTFGTCRGCHSIDPGGAHSQGPALYGVLGRGIGGAGDYAYSEAFAARGGDWDWANMDAFIENPKGWEPGTKMGYRGMADPQDRANLLVYMNEQSDAPLPLPEVAPADDAAQPEEAEAGVAPASIGG